MIHQTLAQAATAMTGRLAGADASFRDIATDTRTLPPGALFIALRGERFDGHAYVAEAARKGAVAAVVNCLQPVAIPQIWVADTRLGLGHLTASWRDRFSVPVIGVTGSNGKTTVKEITAHLLRGEAEVPILATQGNFNNDVGLPLTLARFSPTHQGAVIEMGANHLGEIRYLAGLARPTIAGITLCAPAHLEGFGGLEGVATAKGEIFAALPPGGSAILNADDAFAAYWRTLIPAQVDILDFSLENSAAAVHAQDIQLLPHASRFTLHARGQAHPAYLTLPGRHNIANALAATAFALAAGKSPRAIAARLATVPSVPGRLQIHPGPDGGKLIDDTYNANPGSLRAALRVLANYPAPRWLVLGNMAELGAEGEKLHAQVGAWAAECGVERLFTVGDLARHAATTFPGPAWHASDGDELLAALQAESMPNVTILLKGSRSMRLDRLARALISSTSHR